MEITYFGHSCFLIETGKHRILLDPFISPNELAKDINPDDIKADFIFLSHGHSDHIADVERIYRNTGAMVVGTYEVVSWFNNKGIEKSHPMNHGGHLKFDFGSVKMVNAVHSSAMPDGSYGGNAAGYVFTIQNRSFYYAGDTALHMDMKLIPEEFKIDFAFLPIGNNFTMDINDAVRAAHFVNTKKVIGMHFDTFPYIKIDHSDAKNIASRGNVQLLLMEIGEKINL
jgi:L-ascorbate metabolism protein UlaG (beta-lactamase superfamily)